MRATNQSKAAVSDLSEPIETIKEDLSQLGTDVADAGRQAVQTGKDLLVDSARQVGKQAKNLQEKLCEITAERPGTSLLVALGVGAVVGLWLFRKR